MEFIQATTLIHLKIRVWSGEKKADRDIDLKVGKDGNVPPKKLLDIGRKKIFSPKSLDPFTAIRKAADRICLTDGTRFMGGYSVVDESVKDKIKQLEHLKKRFEEALEIFSANFEINKDAWISENQEYEHIIRNQIPDLETVKQAFVFEFTPYKLGVVPGFEPDANDFANQVLHEVGLMASDIWKRLLKRKSVIGSKSLKKQLLPIIEKLDVLSFGNGRVLNVLNEFNVLMNMIPENERLEQNHPIFNQALRFLSMTGDAEKLELIINGDVSITSIVSNTPAVKCATQSFNNSIQTPLSQLEQSSDTGFYF